MPDAYDLERFVAAQDAVYPTVLAELAAGRKHSHWMWLVFPQIAGLGASAMSQRYAIASLDEARAYLRHDLLGARLRECTELVLAVEGRSAHDIFGAPDDMKFRSSMTLFARASPPGEPYRAALDRFFGGKPDGRTLELLKAVG